MGKRGPKPLPRALRLLGRSTAAVPRQSSPVTVADVPTMPEGLNEAEQAAWNGLLRELDTVPGLASRADRGVCELIARLEPMARAAAIVVRDHGSTLICHDKDGFVKFAQTRPESTFLLKAAAQLKSLYAELGLTPSGRSRVSVTPAAPPSKLDDYLRGRHGA